MKKYLLGICVLFAVASCAHKEQMPEITPAPEVVVPTKAQAVIKPAKGNKVKGVVHFSYEDNVMHVEATLEGLKPGPHGFHIHEFGDCTAPDFSSAGGHFHIDDQKHGALNGHHSHAGDLGNIIANNKGVAKVNIKVEGISFSGETSILGKSVVVHKDKDDFKSQPAGNSGARIGCGLIESL